VKKPTKKTLKLSFTAKASHDLRTPLSVIKWLTELLIKDRVGPLNPEQKELVVEIIKNNEQMIKVINKLFKDSGK
jgi:NtrC-family two-component system sensor histidine kinase KinB